jgi:polyphosphate kinase
MPSEGPEKTSTEEVEDRDEPSDGTAENEVTRDVDLDAPAYYLNRELSELAFQRRVLHEAQDDRNPLLERAKFLAILTQNLDEFFMKRVGGLKQQVDSKVTEPTVDGHTPGEQLELAWDELRDIQEAQVACYQDAVRPALADAGIEVLDFADLSADDRESVREYFESSVLPTLTPLTFDPAHPFPFISNQSLSLAVLTQADDEDEPTFSRVKVPENRPRLVPIEEGERYVLLEDLVEANLDLLFPNVDILGSGVFRVTRNAEVRRNEAAAEDLVNRIERVIHERRFATVVRVEVEHGMPDRAREVIQEELEVDDHEVLELDGPLDFRPFADFLELDRPELKRDEWTPKLHPRLPDSRNVFEEIRRKDVLVHHPYHAFGGTVQRFLDAAATDPDVLAIKAAIYRTARDSQVIESLIEAARNGKQVAVMVELKARFDEENNLRWVKRLEEEGIHVAYGTLGYKTHTKTSLVVREEDDGVQLYSHVGTGNYHSETAKQYEDLGLLTADPDVGHDLVRLFNYFTGHSLHDDYRKLLIAPTNMRARMVEAIRREAEHAREDKDAQIAAKMNRLEDPRMVRELYEASMAGVDVDLVVRDICRLRPGLEGVSETVSVRSVVGRFLEHSRVFRFANGGDPAYFLGSADWMTRNLDNRVEALAPVEDRDLQQYLDDVLETMFADNRRAWELQADGSYVQQTPDGDTVVDVQQRLMERAEVDAPDDDDPLVDVEDPLEPDTGNVGRVTEDTTLGDEG